MSASLWGHFSDMYGRRFTILLGLVRHSRLFFVPRGSRSVLEMRSLTLASRIAEWQSGYTADPEHGAL